MDTNANDSSARHYMEYAYLEMESGGCPAAFAGKAMAHVFDDSSDQLRIEVLALICEVDGYLETYTPDVDRIGVHGVAYANETIRFYRRHERPTYLASKHARTSLRP